jgi:CIC family chloride channel protein
VNRRKRPAQLAASFLRAAIIGLCGGLASLLFRGATTWIQDEIGLTENILVGARTVPTWQLILTPALGALVAGLITMWVVRGSSGTGLSDVMEAVSLKSGPINFFSAMKRVVASMGIIATGGSVGREGPIITISSAASSALTKILRAPERDRGLLLGCGVAAGFASAYNAPIAGALFALEVVIGNFAVELFAPVVVASVTSTLFTWYIHQGSAQTGSPIYALPETPFQMHSLGEIIPYLALGLAAGIAAVGFQRLLTIGEGFFTRLPGPRLWKTVAGGALIGVVGIWFPEVWGNSYEAVGELLNGQGPRFPQFGPDEWVPLCGIMLALGLVKALGTAITVGSGGAGGVFTPTLFVGAGLGGAVGVIVHHFAPHATGDYGGYALVGMGCLVAGTTRAPIMAILVMYEMTRNYEIVLPLMLGCITASLVAQQLYPESIYTEKLRARGVKQPVGLEETVLVTTRVSDVMRSDPITWVDRSMTYGEMIPLATAMRASVIYVCGPEKKLLGSVQVHDLIELASMQDLGPGIIAADLMTPTKVVTSGERLSDVFDLFEDMDFDELPVVDAQRTLTGTVTRKDVMAALHIEVLKRQNLRAKFVHKDDADRATDYVELPKGVELARVTVHPDHVGRTLGSCQVRVRHHLTVVSVIRRGEEGREMRILADGKFRMEAGDQLIVLGSEDAIAKWREDCERLG